jgi:PBP1b-binding outer membrane lipoprotein LpoB
MKRMFVVIMILGLAFLLAGCTTKSESNNNPEFPGRYKLLKTDDGVEYLNLLETIENNKYEIIKHVIDDQLTM